MRNQNALIGCLLTISSALLAACGGSNSNSALLSSSSGTTGGGTATSPSTSSLFTLTVTPENPTPTAVLHNAASWATTGCSFSPTDATTNISCNLEMSEADVYFNNLTFNWSSPTSFCTYVEVHPYWYFKYQPSTGTSLTTADVTYSYTVNNGVIQNLVQTSPASPQLVFVRTSGGTSSVRCAYDYSWISGFTAPNCCQGTQTVTVTTTTSTTTAGVTTTTSTTAAPTSSSWGGLWGNCASGPGTDPTYGFGVGAESRLPMAKMYYTLPGVSAAITVRSPIKSRLNSDVWTANYTPLTTMSPFPIAQPSYGFQCYSASHQLLGSISLYVRKWNSATELAKGASGDPELVTGTGEDDAYPDWYDFNANSATSGFGVYPGLYE